MLAGGSEGICRRSLRQGGSPSRCHRRLDLSGWILAHGSQRLDPSGWISALRSQRLDPGA